MTKENFTSINVLIDRSGSMGHLTNDTIGSFNTFLADQKTVEGEAVFTLTTFSDSHTVVHDFVKLASVPDLSPNTYKPSGGTALLDALGATMSSVGTKLAAMPEDDRPSKVVFLIITDGEENSSREFKLDKIKEMVVHQQEKYGWDFIFMGANIDAITTGEGYGFAARNSYSFQPSSAGTQDLYKSVSDGLKGYRTSGKANKNFTVKQEVKVDDKDKP